MSRPSRRPVSPRGGPAKRAGTGPARRRAVATPRGGASARLDQEPVLPAGLSVEAVELAGETFFLFSFESPGASELPPLTEAEQHVIELVLQGLRTREIATVRGSSHATVCSQLQSIYRKLGVVSRGELVALFA